MEIVDGRRLAEKIKQQVAEEISKLSVKPKLGILACNPNRETKAYLDLKQKIAKSLGVEVVLQVLEADSDTDMVIRQVNHLVSACDGVIVQLPLPVHVDTSEVLKQVPKNKDVDAFYYQGGETTVLPPVVGAIDAISSEYGTDWVGKRVVIFGAGRLVGLPASFYAKTKGAQVQVIDKGHNESEVKMATASADIIILGAGQPNLLTPDLVKPGAVVFDAGASEDGGLLVGDAHKDVALKASLFTPVPGGIGPITIAILFRNLLNLKSSQ
ncbi:MAG: bifunctional 5,10-methylenetetrahydrofolate dehydrogenase/5,10-methenyltetrahydrofolate cyclohydrolase [Candidatus Paceibacterota bacterium]